MALYEDVLKTQTEPDAWINGLKCTVQDLDFYLFDLNPFDFKATRQCWESSLSTWTSSNFSS